MKSTTQEGIVHTLVTLGLISYQAVPVLVGSGTTNAGAQIRWMSQLIVEEKSGANGTFQLRFIEPDERTIRIDVTTAQRWSAAAQLSMTYKHAISSGARVVMLLSTMTLGDAQIMVQRMTMIGQFEYVASSRILRPAFTPSATWFSSQWDLVATNTTITATPDSNSPLQPASETAVDGANLATAWDTITGSNTVNAAIVDTSVLSHVDLAGVKIDTGSNFITSTFRSSSGDSIGTDPGDVVTATDIISNPTACNGATFSSSSWHGTFVVGLVAAQHSGTRVTGIASGVGAQMARTLGRRGGTEPDIINVAAQVNGSVVARISPNINLIPAKVTNMSLGDTGSCDVPMQTAITNAHNRGAVIVVATGNKSISAIDSSVDCTGTVAVTAHTLGDNKATHANMGTGTTPSAPGGSNGSVANGLGVLIASLSNTGTTSVGSPGYSGEAGTPMATPYVIGVTALMLSVNNALTPDQIATVLERSARPFPADAHCVTHTGVCGTGILDASATVALAKSNPIAHVSTSASMVVTNSAVTLTAIGSAGFVNTITSVQWAQTSGPSVNLTTAGPDSNDNYTATFTPSATDTYTSNVMLMSNTGATATDTTNATVTAVASTGTTIPPAMISSDGGGGGTIGLAGAALLLVAGLAGRQRCAE